MKEAVHFAHESFINPTNPVTVNLIGAGGTGSQMLTSLARTDHALKALNHPGLQLTAWDSDTVSEANLGRQLFARSELGLPKTVALINRINRFFGTNWKALVHNFDRDTIRQYPESRSAALTVSCVDTVKARREIAEIFQIGQKASLYHRDKALYWMDMGNAQCTGQVILSTVGKIAQPTSQQYKPISELPWVTDEFDSILRVQADDAQPSCSMAEALTKQDLFINSTLANAGTSLLWNLFREGLTFNRGFFLNLKDFRMQPLSLT